jgi:hypothetical protein
MNNEQFMVNFVETDNYPSLQNFRIFRINKSEIYVHALKMVNEKFSMNYVFLPSDANLRLATTSLFAEQERGRKNLVKLFVFLCHSKILDMNLVSS